MKKLLILHLLLIAMSLPSLAQHVKFMGIPLTGTIAQFQQKLEAKGVRYNSYSKYAGPGVRCFKGTFIGQNANIYVYYDSRTKIVYRAKACIDYSNEEIAERKLEEVKILLKEKYLSFLSEDDTQDGYPSFSIPIQDSESGDIVGVSGLYISDGYDEYYNQIYVLHIDYYDWKNQHAHEGKIMDDL